VANEPSEGTPSRRPAEPVEDKELVLAELVSRVLDRGVVVAGDLTISVAGIDLIYLGLSLRLAASQTLLPRAHERGELPPLPNLSDDRPGDR
jgi:hypothetical protein